MTIGNVYFIECAGRIKIGYSRNVLERLRNLAASSALKINPMGDVAGSKDLEKAIHTVLARHRDHGEWFLDCHEVRSTIEAIKASGPAAIGFVERPERTGPPSALPFPATNPTDRVTPRSPFRHANSRVDWLMEHYLDRCTEGFSIGRADRAIVMIRHTIDATEALLDEQKASRLDGNPISNGDLAHRAMQFAARLERGLAKLFENPRISEIDVSGYDGMELQGESLLSGLCRAA